MNRKHSFMISLMATFLVVASLGSVVLAAGTLTIDRWVIGGGGGHSEAGSYVLDATVGQAMAGVTSNTPYELCAGFWCGMGRYKVFLPLVLRNS